MAAGWDETDGEWATPVDGDVRSLAGWDGEGEWEGAGRTRKEGGRG